jgi:peptide/nickel transport system substrate-binding protein
MGQEDYKAIYLGLTGGTEPHSGANVYMSTGGLHAWHYSAATGDITEVEKRVDELTNLAAAEFNLDKVFEYYKEYQIILSQDLGFLYTINQAFVYSYYNRIGNAQVASPNATPSGNNGLTMDFIFRKS